jgi:hypothetical protein
LIDITVRKEQYDIVFSFQVIKGWSFGMNVNQRWLCHFQIEQQISICFLLLASAKIASK